MACIHTHTHTTTGVHHILMILDAAAHTNVKELHTKSVYHFPVSFGELLSPPLVP